MSEQTLLIQQIELIDSPQFLEKIRPIIYIRNIHFNHIDEYQNLLFKVYQLAPDSIVLFDFLNPHYDLSNAVVLGCEEQQLQIVGKSNDIRTFKRGACGGTFDYLHQGHKLLLSLALLIVKDFLTIGITGDKLLQNKKHKSLIQSFPTRQRVVLEFCKLFSPNCEVHLPELEEPAGPTKDGDYEVLIVTEETQKAIEYINNLRTEKKLNPLQSFTMRVLNSNDQDKLSSSQIRERIFKKCNESYEIIEYIRKKWLHEFKQDVYTLENIIIPKYCEPQRFYHTLQHIVNLLQKLDLFQCEDRLTIFYSIIFHDIIYNPKCNDNEKKSASIFRQFCNSEQIASKVEKYILATEKHILDNDSDEDLKLFLDLDLSILAEKEEIYDYYSKQIRQEYCHYDQEQYRQGRRNVLKALLSRQKIYYHCSQWEELARKNIEREINSY